MFRDFILIPWYHLLLQHITLGLALTGSFQQQTHVLQFWKNVVCFNAILSLAFFFSPSIIIGGSVTKSYLTLCNPMGCDPPGSFVHWISQARILEQVAISFSRDFPNPGIKPESLILQANSLPTEPPGKPNILIFNAHYTL